jgi:hypothetical protein
MDDVDRAVLDVERRTWVHTGPKEQHIRDTLGLTPTRYYQRLSALLDDPEAIAYAPQLMNRLRRRRRSRGAR